jgi:hypothetical protein
MRVHAGALLGNVAHFVRFVFSERHYDSCSLCVLVTCFFVRLAICFGLFHNLPCFISVYWSNCSLFATVISLITHHLSPLRPLRPLYDCPSSAVFVTELQRVVRGPVQCAAPVCGAGLGPALAAAHGECAAHCARVCSFSKGREASLCVCFLGDVGFAPLYIMTCWACVTGDLFLPSPHYLTRPSSKHVFPP